MPRQWVRLTGWLHLIVDFGGTACIWPSLNVDPDVLNTTLIQQLPYRSPLLYGTIKA